MAYRKLKGDVSYYLEFERYKKFYKVTSQYSDSYDMVPAGRPIAYSTKADADWLAYLKPLCNSWEELMSKVDGSSGEYLKSPECMKVVEAYMKKKSDFNKVNWR